MPLIKPTPIDANFANVAQSMVLRLFPELQNTHYVIWGILPFTEESQKTFDLMKIDYKKVFHADVQVLEGDKVSSDDIKACAKPCWILLPIEKAHELEPNLFIDENIKKNSDSYINISWINFEREQNVSDECVHEHRLSYSCIKPVSVKEVERKMKSPHRYFFLRKYNEKDLFLFVQK